MVAAVRTLERRGVVRTADKLLLSLQYASMAVLLSCTQRANHPLFCLLFSLKLFHQPILVVFETLLS